MIKRILIILILLIWELPQNIIGAVFFVIFYHRREKILTDYSHVYLYVFNLYPGMSWGRFIFVMKSPEKNYRYLYKGIRRNHVDLIRHEMGHSVQSIILGPLYFAIVIQSGLWFVFTALVESILGRRFIDYYGFYTELWADVLGGVTHRSGRKRGMTGGKRRS